MAVFKKNISESYSKSDKQVLLNDDTSNQFPQEAQLQSNIALLNKAFGNIDDETLWKKFKIGDQAVFTYIYYKFFNVLCRYGSQFVTDKNQIKDHIHDLFIDIFDRKEKLSSTTSIKFYLMKCLKNRMLAVRKKNKLIFQEDCMPNGFDFMISFSIEEILINDQGIEERNQQLNHAIQKLSKRQREVIYYYYFEELSIPEIMDLMDCGNAKSIQNLIYRSIQYLREHIE